MGASTLAPQWEEMGFQLEPGVCAVSAILWHFNLNSGLDLLEGVHGVAAWTRGESGKHCW